MNPDYTLKEMVEETRHDIKIMREAQIRLESKIDGILIQTTKTNGRMNVAEDKISVINSDIAINKTKMAIGTAIVATLSSGITALIVKSVS